MNGMDDEDLLLKFYNRPVYRQVIYAGIDGTEAWP